MSMINEVCVIGHPSQLGGANAELEHQIYLWRDMGIDVYICPTIDIDQYYPELKKPMLDLGCKYIEPKAWNNLIGLHTISYCDIMFLSKIREIKKYAKSTTYVNCMTWIGPQEIDAHRNNLIDFSLYQTQHQYDKIINSRSLSKYTNNSKKIFFNPYFKKDDFPFINRTDNTIFRFGRISREDTEKYNKYQIWIYESMITPVEKSGIILGWCYGDIVKKIGALPPYIKGYAANSITQQDFYKQCDIIIMTTDTYENLPRVGFEAMSSGTLLIVDNRGGWTNLVEDGKTGWLCTDHKEFAYKASRAAFQLEETNSMRHAARKKLDNEWGKENSIKSWEKIFDAWSKI